MAILINFDYWKRIILEKRMRSIEVKLEKYPEPCAERTAIEIELENIYNQWLRLNN